MHTPSTFRLTGLLFCMAALHACAAAPATSAFVWHPRIAKPGIPFVYSENFTDVLDQTVGGVELTNNHGEKRTFTILRDWCQATDDGWYPHTTCDMACDAWFSHAYEAAAYFSLAMPSKTSFVQSSFAGITLNDVPADLYQAIGDPIPGSDNPRLAAVYPEARIIPDHDHPGTLTVDFNDGDGGRSAECELTILAWGDFNGDGIEDLLVNERFCPGGSLVCRGTSIFTRTRADAPMTRVRVDLPNWKTLDKKED